MHPALTTVLGRSDTTARGTRPQPRADSEDQTSYIPTSPLRALGHERNIGWGHPPTNRPMGPGGVPPTSRRDPDGGGASSSRVTSAPHSSTLGRRGRSPDDEESDPGPRVGRHRTTQSSQDRSGTNRIIAIHRTPGEISEIREANQDLLALVDLRPDEIHESGLRGLGREGILRWVTFTLGGVIIAYAMVVNEENSPTLSIINTCDAIIGGAQLGPHLGPPNSILLGEGHEIRVHWGGGNNPETWILFSLQTFNPPSAFFAHPTLAIGTGRMNFLPDEYRTLGTYETNRLRRAGIPRQAYDLHLAAHVNPLTPTPHRNFPALWATLLGHTDLHSAPRSTILPGLRHDLRAAPPSAQDRSSRLPRSPMRWFSTFNAMNTLATAVTPVITQSGQHDVVMTHDPTSQDPYMTASRYIRIESLAKLQRFWDRGDAVHEVWPWQGS